VCSGLVVTAGAVTPILISLKDKDNKDAMDSDSIITDADVQQLQLDALTKISKKIYYLRHKEGEDNLAHDDIVKQAGAFLYNVNQAVAEVQDKNGNSTLGDDQLNNVKYNAILSESRNAGIDLTGYNYIAKNQDNLVNSYVQQLEQSGLDPTTANKQGQVFAQIYASTVEQGRVEL
jgi:hypothetical protein